MDWMIAGKEAKSSRKKICCFSKAIQRASNNRQKAEAYYRRGYAHYYYTLDIDGETYDKGESGDGVMDEETNDVVAEEASVPRDQRKEDGRKDYEKALELDPNHSDAAFELGVYWYWKAFRQEAVEAARAEEEGETPSLSSSARQKYENAIALFNDCIVRDRWCSTAYDLRSRCLEALDAAGGAADQDIRDHLRSFDSPAAEAGNGLYGYYCDDRDLGALRKLVKDQRVNFDWGQGTIRNCVGANNVSVRWVGRLEIPEPGSYTFSTYADDGVKLWVNHREMIDDWSDHGARWKDSDSLNFQENEFEGSEPLRVPVVMEWYEHGGSAVAKLAWTRPGGSRRVIPKKFLYAPAEPGCTEFPRFFQHNLDDYSKDSYTHNDGDNETAWFLDLAGGYAPYVKSPYSGGSVNGNDYSSWYKLFGNYNDHLTSFRVPKYYRVSLRRHRWGGKTFSRNGKCTISSLGNHTMIQDDKNPVSWNDQVSRIEISTRGGFGEPVGG
jgi:hypothetical protein